MELFSKTSLAVGSTDDVPGCDRTPRRGDKERQAKARQKKEKVGGFWVLG